ncbi:MAG: sugar ABC transporter substrate-binding protein [Acetobacterales bacterium]
MASAPRLAVFTKNLTNPAYAGARTGAERTAARFGAKVDHYVPEAPDDLEQQRALIRDALRARPDAVVLSPVDPTALNGEIGGLVEAGIPIVFLVSRAEGIPCVSYVSGDDYRLAYDIAGYLFDHIGRRGKVLLVDGHPVSTTTGPRARGFRDAARQHHGITVAGACHGDYQRAPAEKAVSPLLQAHPDVAGVATANDVMALGVVDAMAALGRHAPVVGVNAIPEAIKALQQGTLLATSAFNAMAMACLATEAAIRHLRGETIPAEIMLPTEVVHAGNCAAWDLPYEERPLPEWPGNR